MNNDDILSTPIPSFKEFATSRKEKKLRDRFACAALQGLLATPEPGWRDAPGPEAFEQEGDVDLCAVLAAPDQDPADEIAARAYQIANAMLRARRRGAGQ